MVAFTPMTDVSIAVDVTMYGANSPLNSIPPVRGIGSTRRCRSQAWDSLILSTASQGLRPTRLNFIRCCGSALEQELRFRLHRRANPNRPCGHPVRSLSEHRSVQTQCHMARIQRCMPIARWVPSARPAWCTRPDEHPYRSAARHRQSVRAARSDGVGIWNRRAAAAPEVSPAVCGAKVRVPRPRSRSISRHAASSQKLTLCSCMKALILAASTSLPFDQRVCHGEIR
jgi:hypothetical protein